MSRPPNLIPKRHGLPPIHDNIREGNVIRPVDDIYVGNDTRVILKDKNEAFAEIKIPTNFKVDNLFDELKCYITPTRAASVLSKFGETMKRQKLISEIKRDIISEFEETHQIESAQAKKKLYKKLGFEIHKMLDNMSGN